eukprot:2039378-Rhodomonas_salina.1
MRYAMCGTDLGCRRYQVGGDLGLRAESVRQRETEPGMHVVREKRTLSAISGTDIAYGATG